MYYAFCYQAFTNGILKDEIDNTSWEDLSILLHQSKIHSEDEFILMLQRDEEMGR